MDETVQGIEAVAVPTGPDRSTYVIALSSVAALGGFLFLNTLYLQDVRGLSALSAGLYTLPLAVMTLLLAPLSGWIIGRWGPRLPLVVAGVAMTAGGLLLTSLAPDTSVGRLMVAYVTFGIGIGMVNAPMAQPSSTEATAKPVVAARVPKVCASASTVPLITPLSKPKRKPPIAATQHSAIT